MAGLCALPAPACVVGNSRWAANDSFEHSTAQRGDSVRRRFFEPGGSFTDHALDVATLAVQLREAARDGRFDLLELDGENECWREFPGRYGPQWVKPDLYVVTTNTAVEDHAFVEVDRGTEHLPAVLRKCAGYQRYFQTGTEQLALPPGWWARRPRARHPSRPQTGHGPCRRPAPCPPPQPMRQSMNTAPAAPDSDAV